MRKLLWVGDASCQTGFARCTHETLETLRKTWKVSVLGIGSRGDPHTWPYPIYTAAAGGDGFGIGRTAEIAEKEQADLVVLQNDPWNIPAYTEKLRSMLNPPKIVGSIPVDGLNCRGRDMLGLDHAIFWTKFGQREAELGGYTGSSSVIPLGVDLEQFSPGDRNEARKRVGIDMYMGDDAFVVLNVNRNQPRKRIDLTIEYFAEWYHKYSPNAFLYLHMAPTGEYSINIDQLALYYGLRDRIFLAQPEAYKGATDDFMRTTYRAANVLMSTSRGEGFGLTTLEAMACGIVPVVGDWAAHGDWAKDGAILVPCTTRQVESNQVNVIGGIPDKDVMVRTLHQLYTDSELCRFMSEQALTKAQQTEYRWADIGRRFNEQLETVMSAEAVPA